MSSQINNIITTTFRAQGGNVVSQLRSYAAGFGTIGQQINETSNMSTRLNNQWRAIGTTIRYAIAGTALYGLTSMVSKVSQLNVQLAQMQAISNAGIGTSVGISNQQVPALLNNLMNTSVQTITPLTEVNDAATNFLSTVQNVKPSELPQMLTQIGIGAKIAQTPIEDLTQAAATMQVAFGRAANPQTIGQFSRMWQMLVTTAPGGVSASSTIAQGLPGLASMFQLAPGRGVPGNVGQAQMMALSLGVLRTGMPAATGLRGLTYLLQSVAQPTGKAAKALSGIGITPEFVQQQGVFAAVMKLLHQIRPVSGRTARQLGIMDENALPDTASTDVSSLPGIPAAELTRLRTMIPRIHGVRAAIILSSQLRQQGDVSSIQQDLANMLAAQDENSKQSHQLAKSWQQFRQRARLADAANAINTMGLQVAQTFEPVMGFVAQNVLDPVAKAARTHPRATRDIALGGAGFLAAMGIGRFLGAGRLPGLRRLPGISGLLGGAGSAFVREHAISAAMSGGAGLGASPQNPLYVVVVGQLFGGGTPSPTPGGGGGGGGWLSKITNPVSAYLGVKAITSFGGKGLSLLRGAGGALEGLGAEAPGISDWRMWFPGARNPMTHRKNPGWENFFSLGLANRDPFPGYLTKARQFYPHATNVESFLRGQADVNLVIDMTDPSTGKMTRHRVHIPVGLWAGGRHPSHRGQTKKTVRSR